MDRRTFLARLGGGLLAAPLVARAQPTRNVPTIGFLGPPPSAGGLVQAFQNGLLDLGYVEGQNIRVEYRYTDAALQGNPERMTQLADELVRLRPDVLVVSVTEAALAAKRATSTTPIVMVSVSDPVAAGLVSSLARPGGNVTGLCRQTPELIGKNLQLLKETLPDATEIGVLVNPMDPLQSVQIADAREAAKSLGVRIHVVGAHAPTDFDSAFSTMRADRVGAVLVLGGATFYLNRAQIADLALKNRLPSMFQNREFAEAGGLLSYAPSTVANYRRAAYFVDKLLKGAHPADLPVELPSKYELVINLKTAKALGLTIPKTILLRADEVVQ
jgi:putative tryptophan/tyrosine transport system substrate-binding protein